MPNHITNILKIEGCANVDEFIPQLVGEGTDFDLNKIIPMPKELRDVTSPVRIVSEDKLEEVREKIDKQPELYCSKTYPITAKMQAEYIAKYGADNWYDWSIRNWGTKWNTYESCVDYDTITFRTAWSCPLPAIIALSKNLPDYTFTISWADEDFGANVGRAVFKGGEEVEMYSPDSCSKEAYELAFEIMPEYYEYYKWEGDTVVPKE